MAYTAGVIGFGRVGRNHAEAFIDTDGVDLVAIADREESLVAELGDRWEVPGEHRYHDHAALLEGEDLDVLSVATPEWHHHDPVLDAAESPTPPAAILCEKPLSTSVRRAEAMVGACEAAGTELVVNHSRRFATAHETLVDLLHDDRLLGEIQSAHLSAAPELLNQGTHYVDLLLYLLDSRIADVRGGHLSPTDDGSRLVGGGTLTMADGAVAFVDPVATEDRLSIRGTEGTLSCPLSVGREGDWEYWRHDGGARELTDPPAPLGRMWAEDISGTHSTYEPSMVPAQTLFENAVEHLVALLDGRADNAAPGRRAVHGLEALTGLAISEYAGGRIDLPLAAPFRGTPLALD